MKNMRNGIADIIANQLHGADWARINRLPSWALPMINQMLWRVNLPEKGGQFITRIVKPPSIEWSISIHRDGFVGGVFDRVWVNILVYTPPNRASVNINTQIQIDTQ